MILEWSEMQNKAITTLLKKWPPLPSMGFDCTLTHKAISWFLFSDCALWFRTSPLMMEQIKFWWNSDLFKNIHFSSSKTDKVGPFLNKSLKCLEVISLNQKLLWIGYFLGKMLFECKDFRKRLFVRKGQQAQFEVPHSEIQIKLDGQLNW